MHARAAGSAGCAGCGGSAREAGRGVRGRACCGAVSAAARARARAVVRTFARRLLTRLVSFGGIGSNALVNRAVSSLSGCYRVYKAQSIFIPCLCSAERTCSTFKKDDYTSFVTGMSVWSSTCFLLVAEYTDPESHTLVYMYVVRASFLALKT